MSADTNRIELEHEYSTNRPVDTVDLVQIYETNDCGPGVWCWAAEHDHKTTKWYVRAGETNPGWFNEAFDTIEEAVQYALKFGVKVTICPLSLWLKPGAGER